MLCWLQSYNKQMEQNKNLDVFGRVTSLIWSPTSTLLWMFLLSLLLYLKYLADWHILSLRKNHAPVKKYQWWTLITIFLVQKSQYVGTLFQQLNINLDSFQDVKIAHKLSHTASPPDLYWVSVDRISDAWGNLIVYIALHLGVALLNKKLNVWECQLQLVFELNLLSQRNKAWVMTMVYELLLIILQVNDFY